MATLEDELSRMGVLERNVPEVAKAIRDAAVCSTLSVDGILSGLKIIMDLEKPRVLSVDLDQFISGKRATIG